MFYQLREVRRSKGWGPSYSFLIFSHPRIQEYDLLIFANHSDRHPRSDVNEQDQSSHQIFYSKEDQPSSPDTCEPSKLLKHRGACAQDVKVVSKLLFQQPLACQRCAISL